MAAEPAHLGAHPRTDLLAGRVHQLVGRVHQLVGRTHALAGIVGLLLVSALWTLLASPTTGPDARPAPSAARTALAHALPLKLAPLASGSADSAYWARAAHGSLAASGAGIRSVFTGGGAQLGAGGGVLRLATARVGRENAPGVAAHATLTSARNIVVYRSAGMNESYRNGPYGLEQTFIVRSRPRAGSGPLLVTMNAAGTLTPRAAGSHLVFQNTHGAVVLRYGQLAVTDASGRRLSARMRVEGSAVQLVINDSHARYPLRIDPFIQTASLSNGSDEQQSFGGAVAISGDGNTALVGDPGGVNSGVRGVTAVWVYMRTGSTWALQAKLESSEVSTQSSNPSCERFFGWSLALSGDGDTALVGNPCGAHSDGQAFVFTRSGSTWTQQGPALVPIGEVNTERGIYNFGGQFGSSVALSKDGNTALVGGQEDDNGEGAAWVFTRSGSTWTQQGAKLTAGSGAELGAGVALSADGDTALLGGPNASDGTGAAWVFTRSGTTWTQQGEALTGSGEVHDETPIAFGTGVALSAKGTTALIGGPGDDDRAGAAWVFTRSATTWTQQGEKLTAGTEPADGGFGRSVALSRSGNIALVGIGVEPGRPAIASEGGAAWAFRRSASSWRQLGRQLTPTPGSEETIADFGFAVSLSAKGTTALIGGPASGPGPTPHGNKPGEAWIFERHTRATLRGA